MPKEFLEVIYELNLKGEPFAVATVVRAERPISAKPGFKAIIKANGTFIGWLGGSCTKSLVVKEALKALKNGNPRLLTLSKEELQCHSGGAVDIYIEPNLPKPRLLIVGSGPIAEALAKLAKSLNFTVIVSGTSATKEEFPEADQVLNDPDLMGVKTTPQTYIVIATMGGATGSDEECLEQVVNTAVPYIGLVASKRRAGSIVRYLLGKGVPVHALRKVKSPAGLDIGAVEPEEIALSIMAEIVGVRRGAAIKPVSDVKATQILEAAPKSPNVTQEDDPQADSSAVDPVCKMTVNKGEARYKSTYGGQTFYFCSRSCKDIFDAQHK